MKVLILSCATGEGHNSAAQAIREYFKLHKINHFHIIRDDSKVR